MTGATCGWCSEPAVTEVITRPGRTHRKTAPVCERHAKEFEDRDVLTARVEFDRKMRAAAAKSEWVRRTWGGS